MTESPYKKVNARPPRSAHAPKRSKSTAASWREEVAHIKTQRAAVRGTFMQERMERHELTADLERALTQLAAVLPVQEAEALSPEIATERRALAGILGAKRQQLATKLESRSAFSPLSPTEREEIRFELARTTVKLAMLKQRQGEYLAAEELLASAQSHARKLPMHHQVSLRDLGLPAQG